ncbi:MAG TPA: NUDIX domain-containing protein [Paracoccaceae bacterium]|nr:NUDIX domain-containing protein [Paracoccaceae bacterium]
MDLTAGPKLVPAAAVAALMVTPDGRYLMQHRDDLPGIFFPGFWGCFGGAIEPGESPRDALLREIFEELAYSPRRAEPFATLGLDFSFQGHGTLPRHFFTVAVDPGEVASMRLAEGQGLALIPGAEILTMPRVVPYDAIAIWQHASRARF